MTVQDAYLSELTTLLHGDHWDPHHFLGLHPFFEGKQIIRLYRPGAPELFVEVQGEVMPAHKVHEAGLFELIVPHTLSPLDYRVYHQNGLLAHDPYSFQPTWGEIDSYLFSKGTHYQLYEVMGAHEVTHQGIRGVRFAVWAPGAMSVSVVGDFNFWDGRVNPMRSMGGAGVWELFIPGLTCGSRYKFEIKTQQKEILVKADPYSNASELRPMTASIVADLNAYSWGDQEWIGKRQERQAGNRPLNIYELHLGSWKREHGHPRNFRDLAKELAHYCQEMGYTHVELMAIAEHPLDESWGYQVSGFLAVTSRYGSPQDFQFFVDYLHKQGIGVLLDWVPAHFPSDAFSLARFDGTCLYEHADPRQGFHPHWNTLIFNYGRHEVVNFLIASALFWIEKLHIDGLRMDAVASMIYLDYGREFDAWIPNELGGKENLEAIEFLKHLNSIIHQRFPGVITIAEESTSFPGVTRPVESGGLGFDYKWNMGWMNDTLRYFHRDTLFRRYHQNELTFGLLYAFSEKFILVLSHDEVVYGKRSLLSKMPGDEWQKFANVRLLLSYMTCQPGKKMVFMGGEIGQHSEWWVKEEIHWHLLQYPLHHGLQEMVKELNRFYLQHPPLWTGDFDYNGFEWVNFSDVDNCVLSYKRKGGADYELFCVHNFTPTYHQSYYFHLPNIKSIEEIFNTDDERYGGSGKKNGPIEIVRSEGRSLGVNMQLSPLATAIFKVVY